MHNEKQLTVGLIGAGSFGQLVIQHLADRCALTVFDTSEERLKQLPAGVKAGTLPEVALQSVIILAVPIQAMPQVLQELSPLLTKPCLLLDVASVKEKPCEWLQQYAPPFVEVMGTHPLFGKESAKNGLTGLRVVLCPIRTTKTLAVKLFLEKMGLQVIETTPTKHDQAMAAVQGLTHFVGAVLNQMELPTNELGTKTFESLMYVGKVVQNDSPELFSAIQLENPYAKEVRERFVQRVNELNEHVRKMREEKR